MTAGYGLLGLVLIVCGVTLTAAAECGYKCSVEDETLDCWRENIDYYSDIILEALNQRAVVANHIGEWKRKRGLPIVDHSRIGAVLARIASRNPGPLPNSAIVNVFGAIVNETALYEEKFSGKPAMYQCRIDSVQNDNGNTGAVGAALSSAGVDLHVLLVAVLAFQVILVLVMTIALVCIVSKLRKINTFGR